MLRNLILTSLIAVAALRCAQPAETKQVVSTELPKDVQSVAKAASASVESQATTTSLTPSDGNLSATGEFISASQSQLAPKFPGRIAAVYVDDGARVTRGQPLAALESDYLRLDAQRAEADLARATAVAEEARRDFERKKELRAKESIPQATYDRAQAAYEQSQAARASASSTLALAKQRLADAVLRAPLTGVVADRQVDVGEHIGEAGVAFVIEQTAPLKLRFQLPERYLATLKPGQVVVATVDPYPGEKFTGTVKTVGGTIDPQSRTLFAEAEFANADGRLRPGLFAKVEMKLN